MDDFLKLVIGYFNFKVLLIFIITGLIILLKDAKQYGSSGLSREAKVSKCIGYLYIISGLLVYIASKII